MNDEKSGTARERIADKTGNHQSPLRQTLSTLRSVHWTSASLANIRRVATTNQQGVNQPDRSALDPENKSDKF